VEQHFSDEVRECLDRLYEATRDEFVRSLYRLASDVDHQKLIDMKSWVLLMFMMTSVIYLNRYRDRIWYGEVLDCIARAVAREAERLYERRMGR